MSAVAVRVLYFGIVRERLGVSEEQVDVEPPATVGRLMRRLTELHPDLAEGVASLRVALNQEYVGEDASLADDDEVAIIPPVSGGTCV
ncbi:MAG: molybdopterin converting factor subunit 1 [Deltaproteobacteria bacterium]|nr:MAG: molybdopterin converting factor subunit 1 [Deltaproteobacteria bacterium]